MNSQTVGRAGKALLFMHRCRQSSQLQHSSTFPVRNASQATPISPNASPPRVRVSKLTPVTRPKGVVSEDRPPTEIRVENPGPSIWTAIKTVLGIKPKLASDFVPAPFNAINNPYKARKKWPPNFKNLHPKHQFRYEKTYRRRMKLKYARPTWTKATKIVQYALIWGVLVYWVFFLDMGDDGTPFDNIRAWAFKTYKNLGKLPDRTEDGRSKLADRVTSEPVGR